MVGKILGYGLLLSEGDVHKVTSFLPISTYANTREDAKEKLDASLQFPTH